VSGPSDCRRRCLASQPLVDVYMLLATEPAFSVLAAKAEPFGVRVLFEDGDYPLDMTASKVDRNIWPRTRAAARLGAA
jgi:hypothetical protein